ncbi:MAG: VWA domain-containing protein [Pseudomonadota bacterium]|nr:VWA domain-containing protein [Pseudomonadota bacterium]
MKRLFPLVLLLASCSDEKPGFSEYALPATSRPAPPKQPEGAESRRAESSGEILPLEAPPAAGEATVDDRKQLDSLGYDPAVRKNAERQRGEQEWGGRIFLSNDDSMSLASAQRVLWSVGEGRRVASAELRPHELLNYFTFETPPVPRGQTFGITASAVRTDAGLSVALAVTGATPARRPLDLTLVLDRSGSMAEEGRMDFLKRGLVQMLDRLHAGDRVDVVLFDDEVSVAKRGFVVGQDDLDDLRLLVEEIQPRGATDLDAGLEAAYKLARSRPRDAARDARVVVVTDAKLTAGDVDPARVTEIARAFDESGIRLAAVGVGRDFDDDVLQRLTEKGRGAYVYLGSEKVVDRVFGAGFDALVHIVADDVRFALDLPDSLGMRRFYGEEMSTVAADVVPVSFHAGTTQVFLQDLAIAPSGIASKAPLVLDVTWRDPLNGNQRTQRWSSTVGEVLAADRANVTKARALMAWTDLARVGDHGCHDEKREWTSRARAFGGDTETRYLDGLVAGWCREPERSTAIAEAE